MARYTHCTSQTFTNMNWNIFLMKQNQTFVITVKSVPVIFKVGHMPPPPKVPKGPQDSDRKSGSHNNFWADHENLTACIKYFKFKIESKVPFSPCIPRSTEGEVMFHCLTHVLYGWIKLFAVKKHVTAWTVKTAELRLSLTALLQPDVPKPASVHQAQGTHRM